MIADFVVLTNFPRAALPDWRWIGPPATMKGTEKSLAGAPGGTTTNESVQPRMCPGTMAGERLLSAKRGDRFFFFLEYPGNFKP